MGIDPTLILLWTAALAVTAGVMALVVRALFRDRSNGRRRCPRCWHDMQQLPGLRCPECGSTVRDESRLYQTRRHWRRAVLLLVGLFAGAMALRVNRTGENLFEYAPTWFLTRTLPFSRTQATDPIREALLARVARRTLTPDQTREVARLIREGDSTAPPTSLAWQGRYGGLLESLIGQGLDALERGETADPALEALESFRDLPPLTTVTSPAAWPAGEPLVVELAVDEWWPPTTYARVRIRDDGDGTEHVIGLDSGGAAAPRHPFTFSPAGAGGETRRFTITVEARKTKLDGSRDPDQPWGPAHVSHATVAIPVTDEMHLTTLSGPESDEAIKRVFREGLVVWTRGWRRYGLRFDPAATADDLFRGTLVGLDIEVRQGEILRRHSRIWWPSGSGPQMSRWEILSEDPDPIPGLASGGEGWTARIRGTRDVAMRALAAARPSATSSPFTRYWEGEVTLPLEIQVNDSTSPRRRWFALQADDLPSPASPPPSPSS